MNPGESSLRHVAVCEACGRCGSGQYDTPTEAKLAMLQHGHWAWATSGTGGVVCPICLTLGPKHKALSEGDVTSCGVRSACRCTPHPCRQSRLREPVIAKLVPWIHANCQHRKTLDTKNNSYAWKHRAEATERQEAFGWPRRELVRGIGEYVSNGEFIVAAIRAGYRAIQKDRNGINAFFDMTLKRERDRNNPTGSHNSPRQRQAP